MWTIRCINSENISVMLMLNGNHYNDIMAIAMQDDEYWFTIGRYKSEKGAKKAAIKTMKKYGFLLNEDEVMSREYTKTGIESIEKYDRQQLINEVVSGREYIIKIEKKIKQGEFMDEIEQSFFDIDKIDVKEKERLLGSTFDEFIYVFRGSVVNDILPCDIIKMISGVKALSIVKRSRTEIEYEIRSRKELISNTGKELNNMYDFTNKVYKKCIERFEGMLEATKDKYIYTVDNVVINHLLPKQLKW